MTSKIHLGRRRHMRWAAEEGWKALPDAPSWSTVPILDGRMKLGVEAEPIRAETAYGGHKRGALEAGTREVKGRVDVPAWPEPTSLLLEAALTRVGEAAASDRGDLQSFCVDFYSPPDPRRCRGVKVARLALHLTPSTSSLEMQLRGGTEEAAPELGPDVFDYTGLVHGPFRLRGAELTVDGTSVTEVERFALVVENDLRVGPPHCGEISFLVASTRTVRLVLEKFDASSFFADALRNGSTIGFNANCTHPAGPVLQIDLSNLYVVQRPGRGQPESIARENPRLEASGLSGNDLQWSIATPTTTTTTPAP